MYARRENCTMYQAYWGLSQSPFSAAAGQAIVEQSPLHAEALARLAFLVEHRSQLGLLTGPAGSGKSLVLSQFARQQRAAGTAVAELSCAGGPPRDALVEIAMHWGANPDSAADTGRLWRIATDRLAELRLEQVPAVLVIDDAHTAAADVLNLVHRLLKLPDGQLTVVAAASETAIGRLPAWLLELAELRIELSVWTEDETRHYLKSSLSRAGRQQPAFADRAVRRLFELSAGVPRRVNQLAQLALVAGAGQQLAQIDEQTVLAVHEELSAAR
jgi:type II secretory pathway predicted ATPase ExeA